MSMNEAAPLRCVDDTSYISFQRLLSNVLRDLYQHPGRSRSEVSSCRSVVPCRGYCLMLLPPSGNAICSGNFPGRHVAMSLARVTLSSARSLLSGHGTDSCPSTYPSCLPLELRCSAFPFSTGFSSSTIVGGILGSRIRRGGSGECWTIRLGSAGG